MSAGRRPPRWLWRGVFLVGGLALAGALVLLGALGLGWNDPRPAGPPDWQASGPRRLVASPQESRAVLLMERPSGAFVFEAVATVRSGARFNGYGLVFRARDDAQYTVFAVGGDGYLGVLDIDGEAEAEVLPWRTFPHVRRGEGPNRLRVACAAGACRFWVNDEVVTTISDEATGGAVGLWARWYEGEAVDVTFSEVAVWE